MFALYVVALHLKEVWPIRFPGPSATGMSLKSYMDVLAACPGKRIGHASVHEAGNLRTVDLLRRHSLRQYFFHGAADFGRLPARTLVDFWPFAPAIRHGNLAALGLEHDAADMGR